MTGLCCNITVAYGEPRIMQVMNRMTARWSRIITIS
jgi:hypothetical protein